MSLKNGPQTLFLQCIQFIADNVEIVESFVGFPSQIGELIFKQCLVKNKFMTENQTALALFATEFGSDLLRALNLSGKFLCLNYYLENLLLFTDITELDVSNCGLDDKHEILTHFASLHRLEVLNLSRNCISTAGIQSMTTPFRMLKRGPRDLRLLDISGNSEVSLRCLKYLSPFTKIAVILPGSLPEKLSDFRNWELTVKDSSFHYDTIVNKGWATRLIECWVNRVRARKVATEPRKQSFYKKSICPLDITASARDFSESETIIAVNQIGIKKKELSHPVIAKHQDDSLGVEDESLHAMYKTQDAVNKQAMAIDALDNFDTTNSRPCKSLCKKGLPIRSLSRFSSCKTDSINKPNCDKVLEDKVKKKEKKTMKQYFASRSQKVLNHEGILSEKMHKPESKEICKNVSSDMENVIQHNLNYNKVEHADLSKNAKVDEDKALCTGQLVNKKGTVNPSSRKRKRIVICRPLTEESLDDDVNVSAKQQKFDTGNTFGDVTDNGKKQRNVLDRNTKPSFLDCLDAFS